MDVHSRAGGRAPACRRIAAIAILAAAPVLRAQTCGEGAPLAGQEVPSEHGRWLGPWVFSTLDYSQSPPAPVVLDLVDPCQPLSEANGIAHAILLPKGDRAGRVLVLDKVGRVGFWDPAVPDFLDPIVAVTFPGPADAASWNGCNYQLFCSGHTPLPDGRILFVGGAQFFSREGTRSTTIFDPMFTDGSVSPWEAGPQLAQVRYYPAAITMLQAFEGRALILGGTALSSDGGGAGPIRAWERLVPLPGVEPCQGVSIAWAAETLQDPAAATEFEYYPRAHQLSDAAGTIFVAGDTHVAVASECGGAENLPGSTWFLVPPAPGSTAGTLVSGPQDVDRFYGSAVLLHQLPAHGGPDRVLLFGGSEGCLGGEPECCKGSVTVHSAVRELRYVAGGASELVDKAPLKCPRVYSNAVLLPTGEVFISRGSSRDPQNVLPPGTSSYDPLPNPEIYDPGLPGTPGSSRYGAAIPSGFAGPNIPALDAPPPRVYHHLALLLPSGQVAVMGGEPVPGSFDPDAQCGLFGTSSFSGEIFEPPYMFQGWKPEITQAPEELGFEQTFRVDFRIKGSSLAALPDRVVLIRTASVTHHEDSSQRYVELPFGAGPLAAIAGDPALLIGSLLVTAPAPTLAPPGYYLLFVVARDGTVRVPSAAKIVLVQ